MTGLAIVKPVTVTDSILTSTDVPETDYTAWNAATAYVVGDRVIRTTATTHKVYERLVNGTTATAPESDSTNWVEVSPTNRWKLFDTSNSTATSQAASMTYTLTPGQTINAVAALNVIASSVRIRLTDPTDGLVYDETTSLAGVIPGATWYDYFFAVATAPDQVIALELPPYPSAALQVDFSAASGNVSCGVLLMGYMTAFGEGIEMGARAGIQDYSRKETNQWGDTVLTQRKYAKRAEWSMKVANTQIDELLRFLAAVRATPCFWVGYADYTVTTVFGFYKDFDILINYPTYSDCNLTLEGMT